MRNSELSEFNACRDTPIMLVFDPAISDLLWGADMPQSDRIGRRLKLQDLHVLLTVVEAGSMRKAAEVLNTSQPAISRSIAELENSVGVRLLDRNPQGIAPTACGRALLDGGTAAFDELRQAVKKIEFLADPTAGEVRIGSIIPLAVSFVSTVVDRLSPRYPRMVFHFVTGGTEILHRNLHERKVDFLVARRYGPAADDREDFEFLFEDSYVVVAGAKSPLVHRRGLALADLVDQSWVLAPPDSALWSLAMEVFRAGGLDRPRAVAFADPAEVRMALVANGRFLSILPASAFRFPNRRPELKTLPVQLLSARVEVGIVKLKNRTLSPVAQLFIDDARKVAKPLVRRN
jgi:DNA-binding transcriptional LysR family regulator